MGMTARPQLTDRDVYDAITEALSEKVARSGDGLKRLRSAHDLAHKPTRKASPLPEIASYRLAHMLLRSARTEEELQEVDGLLKEASAPSVRRRKYNNITAIGRYIW